MTMITNKRVATYKHERSHMMLYKSAKLTKLVWNTENDHDRWGYKITTTYCKRSWKRHTESTYRSVSWCTLPISSCNKLRQCSKIIWIQEKFTRVILAGIRLQLNFSIFGSALWSWTVRNSFKIIHHHNPRLNSSTWNNIFIATIIINISQHGEQNHHSKTKLYQ